MKLSADEFFKQVIENTKSIPRGRVVTYGQLAQISGKPQGARGVSWILHSCSRKYKLPWHRVINAQGKISFDKNSSNYQLQRRRLIRENIKFDSFQRISLEKYRWGIGKK